MNFRRCFPTRTVQLRILVGDSNGNGAANATDVAQTKSQAGHATVAQNFRSEVNANGIVNASDVALIKGSMQVKSPAKAFFRKAGRGN